MARDLGLLAAAEEGRVGARIYTWNSVWVTLGRFQDPEEALVDPKKVPWIQRPTGGAAVLHGHDITVGLAFPLQSSVRGSYRIATRPLIEALEGAGIPATLAETLDARARTPSAPTKPDCFAEVSANDLIDPATREKVCGCALRRTRKAVLLQASIPVGLPLAEPRTVIIGGNVGTYRPLNAERFAACLRESVERFAIE